MKLNSAAALAFGLSLLGSAAFAQAPARTRIRGTIDAVKDERLDLTTRQGEKVTVSVGASPTITALSNGKLSDVKPGSYVGTAAVPQPDGTLKALELQVFPESMRGVGEGSRPWDAAPQSSMTNGTVGSVVGTSGRDITIQYGGGEKKVVVPPGAPVVTYEPGTRALLTPGAHVFIMATRSADGTLSTDRVIVGKDGIVPPM
jgi:hypothetical protein